MRKVELWGYTIYEDGRIIGLHGKEINYNRQIKVQWGNKKKAKMVYYARFVYYAFNYKNFNFNDKTIVVQHINGDNKDCHINNLVAVKRKFISQGQNNGLAKLTDAEVEEIKLLYRQGKEDNLKDNDPTTKVSYRKLAEQYGVSHTLIKDIINGKHRNKDNYIMK